MMWIENHQMIQKITFEKIIFELSKTSFGIPRIRLYSELISSNSVQAILFINFSIISEITIF